MGDSTIEVLLPFGRRTNVEWCYLLGNFGVRVEGERRVLTLPPKLLGFDSITGMGLPHYGGIVHYDVPVESHGGEVIAFTPHYRAGVISVEVDGEKAGHIAYPPYAISLGELPAGKHTITFSLYLSRHNAFGAVHCADEKCQWKGPGWWRTDGDSWTDSYRLLPEGLLTAPRILEDRKEH